MDRAERAARIDCLVRAAAEAGRELVRVAPKEFHVQTKTWQDGYADYTESKGAIAWSYSRIEALIRRDPVLADTKLHWLPREYAAEYLRSDMDGELRLRLVKAAAEKAGCQIKSTAGHGPGYGYSTDVQIDHQYITYTSRMGIGD